MNITKSNTLSFYNEQGILTLNAKQFDTGRRFVFHIMDNDEPFDLSDCNAYLRIAKADGTQFQDHECCTIDGSKIIIDTSVGNGSQILAAAGANTCELHLEDADGISLTTWNFNILVEPRVHDGSHITSIDSFDILDIAKRNEDTREKNEEIRQSKETKRQESETQRQENETQRQENETQRQENEVIRKSKFEIIENKVGEITDEAKSYATNAKSWAVGGTNTRTGEDTDNSKHYYEQIKSIAESFSGTLRPRGTIAFTALPALSSTKEGDMYNISDQFTTNTDFKEGSGHTIPAGSNIYKTADGKWDVLAGTPVTGIKGANENTYRRGNVNITADDVGALSTEGGSISDDDNEVIINPSGIVGDSTQHLTDFYEITAEKVDGKTLYYNAEDTDERYLKKDDTNFLDTKKGGTVNNSFKVNKVSTTNPTGLTEIDIHNDGKIAFNTDLSQNGNINDSLVHLSGGPIDGRIAFNGSSMDVFTLGLRFHNLINGIKFDGEPKILFGGFSQILAEGIILRYYNGNPSQADEAKSQLSIEDDTIEMSFVKMGTGIKATEKSCVFSVDGIKLRNDDIKIGVLNDYFLELNGGGWSSGQQVPKSVKIRGGSNAYIEINRNNVIYLGTENGYIVFADFSNNTNIVTISQKKNEDRQILRLGSGVSFERFGNDADLDIKAEGYIYFHPGSEFTCYISHAGIKPASTDAQMDLGDNTSKWRNIYATNGTIQTSDRNEKNTINELTAEKAQALIYGLKPTTYKMNNGTSDRTHWGMISQDIEELLEELNWTSFDFAGFIKSPKKHIEKEKHDENGKITRERVEEVIEGEYDYSLRYDEFIAPLIKTVQAQHSEIENLKQEMTLLKQQIQDLLNREV